MNNSPSLKLSIIIIAFNAATTLENCVRACEESDVDENEFEIIIVDNGSVDYTHSVMIDLAKKYRNVMLVNSFHVDEDKAKQMGMKIARGKDIIFRSQYCIAGLKKEMASKDLSRAEKYHSLA